MKSSKCTRTGRCPPLLQRMSMRYGKFGISLPPILSGAHTAPPQYPTAGPLLQAQLPFSALHVPWPLQPCAPGPPQSKLQASPAHPERHTQCPLPDRPSEHCPFPEHA